MVPGFVKTIDHMRSYGMELEWSNVDKNATIDPKLGCWEGKGSFSEVDIINYINGEFTAAWPNKQYGAEINTTPTSSIGQQVNNIRDLFFDLTPSAADAIVVTPISNGHVHIRDSAFEDLEVLKKLYRFTIRNQDHVIRYWLDLDTLNDLKKAPVYHKNAWHYLRNDGGKRLSANFEGPVEKATTLDEFYRALVPHAKDSGNILWARAGRQGINLHSLRHTGTVEFRCMKASVNCDEIRDQLLFADDFISRAIDGGPDYTYEELRTYNRPPIDPDDYFSNPKWADGLKDWWDTREDRKKTGIKVRLGKQDVA